MSPSDSTQPETATETSSATEDQAQKESLLSRWKNRIADRADAWLPWLLLALLFAAVVCYYAWPPPKSFFLDLTTDHLSVVTDEDTQIVWELRYATICLPRHMIDPGDYATFESPSPPRCDEEVYLELEETDIELDWPEGVELVMRPGPNRSLDVVMRFPAEKGPVLVGDIEVSSESILTLPPTVFSEFGGLSVTGKLRAGQLAENGTLMMLRSGKYETRERYWLREPASLVDSGTFSLGDVVSIERRNSDKHLSSYAFLTLVDTPTPTGPTSSHLRVIASTEEAYSQLRLERAKAAATFLEPSWAQRLSRDPFVIGLATVLSLFAATLAIVNAFRRKRGE